MTRFLVAVLACVFTSGCVPRLAHYSDSWADRVEIEGGGCPDVDGVYQTAGEYFEYDTQYKTYRRLTVNLVDLLLQRSGVVELQTDAPHVDAIFDDRGEGRFQPVKLQVLDGALRVETARADGATRKFALPIRPRCRDSSLFLEADWGDSVTSAYVYSMLDRSVLSLGKTEDGSLLVRDKSFQTSLLFFVPVPHGPDSRWMRFPPVVSE